MALEDGCSCNYQEDTHHAELSRKINYSKESDIHADQVQVYWNLDGFQNPDDATVNNYTVHLPYSGQRVAVDGILIPNGTILPNEQGGVFDFWSSPKKLGANMTSPDLVGGCANQDLSPLCQVLSLVFRLISSATSRPSKSTPALDRTVCLVWITMIGLY
jgi:hypothetical protein